MRLKNVLLSLVRRQSFMPGFLGMVTNPFFFIRRALYVNIKELAPKLSGDLLDFGCGRKPYETLFSVSSYTGIDVKQTGHEHTLSRVDVYFDGKTIPFKEESFDSVFCSEVFEHIFDLDEIVKEIGRVLKTDGLLLLTVPFCWNEHEVPYDFGRYTSFGIRHVLSKSGFEIVEQRKTGNFIKVNVQLLALYVYSVVSIKNKWISYALRMLFIVPINVVGTLLTPIFPRNNSLYFNNIVLARKS